VLLFVLGRAYAELQAGAASPRSVLAFAAAGVLLVAVGSVVGQSTSSHGASPVFARTSAVLGAWLMVNRIAWPWPAPLGIELFDAAVALRGLLSGLTVSLVAHTALVFPERHGLLRTHPRATLSLVYLQAALYLADDLLAPFGLHGAAALVDRAAQISGAALLAGVAILLIARTRRLRSWHRGRRLVWVVRALALGALLPVIACVLIPGPILGAALPFGALPLLAIVLLPLGFAVAILFDHALESDHLLRRSLASLAGTLALGGCFVAAAGVAAYWLAARASPLTLFGGMLATAIAASLLLRAGVEAIRWIDQLFDRRRQRDRDLLEHLATHLPTLPTAAELGAALRNQLPVALGLSHATLLVRIEQEKGFVDPLDATRRIDAGAAGLVARASRTRAVLRRLEDDGGPDLAALPRAEQLLLRRDRVAGVVPVVCAESTFALLLVGAPAGGRALDAEDCALLRTVAAQAAVALQNGRLVEVERRTATHHREVLAGIATGVVVIDAAGRLESLNRAAATLLGIDAAAWIGAEADSVEALAPFGAALDHAGPEDPPLRGELDLPAGAGGRRQVRYIVQRLLAPDSEGKELGTQLLLDDVTEQRRLERAATLRSKLETLGRFSGFVVHDVGNLAEELEGALLRIGPGSGDSPELAEALRECQLRVRRIHELVRSQGEFVRGRSGPVEPLDLRELALAALGSVPRDARLEIVRRPWDEVPPVRGDAAKLRRVVENLAKNAIQAMEGRGILRLGVSTSRAGSVTLEVADTGPGVPPEWTADLFEPFASSRPGGQGLGLAFVLDTVSAHGGRIDLHNEPGEGATFRITLPAERGIRE